jgi:hypothetical protein
MSALLLAATLAASAFTPTVTFETRPSPTGAPTLQLGILSEELKGDFAVAAKSWALANRQRLGMHPASTLRFEAGFQTRFGASLHYVQQLNDIDVYQAKLVVTVDERGRIVQLASSLVGPRPSRFDGSMSHDDALRHSVALVPLAALDPADARRALGTGVQSVFAVNDELHLGWLMHVASADASKNWYLAFDAVTGASLFVQNRVHHQMEDPLAANIYPLSPGPLDAGVGATPVSTGSLTHRDGRSMIGATCEIYLPDGGFEVVPNDAGVLCGNRLTSYNCCTNVGCVPDAGVKRFVGPISAGNFSINVDLPQCDRVNQATNQRPEGNYRYAPVDPPRNRMVVEPNDPANSDTFAHVHSFFHVNRVYDWVSGLSTRAAPLFPQNQPALTPFLMRDERRTPARRPAVLSNVMIPDTSGGIASLEGFPQCLAGAGVCRIANLGRIDNAAFFPVENFAALPFPGLTTGVDTLVIFQGNSADAAYDATVLWHEFGHGVVYATAALTFTDVAIDNRSANNEGGALHEGFADYIAGAFGNTPDIGPYFGPRALAAAAGAGGIRQDGYLRTMSNTLACPEVLWGQVHQDSQHVSAALWSGRQQNLGNDNGATYDAAFYAMLVSLAPNATFADVARVMAARVSTALGAPAGVALEQVFRTKGVTGCSKILSVSANSQPRPFFGVPQAPMMPNTLIPGPFQFRLAVPQGAQAIRIRGRQAAAAGGLPGMTMGPPPVTVLVRPANGIDPALGAITFSRTQDQLTNDAEFTGQVQASQQGQLNGQISVRVPCGANQEVYVALASEGGGAQIQGLQVTAEPLANCMLPLSDGGVTPDAGPMGEPDAGPGPGADTKMLPAAGTISQPTAQTGCGCGVGAEVLLGAALVGLLRPARRRGAWRATKTP